MWHEKQTREHGWIYTQAEIDKDTLFRKDLDWPLYCNMIILKIIDLFRASLILYDF